MLVCARKGVAVTLDKETRRHYVAIPKEVFWVLGVLVCLGIVTGGVLLTPAHEPTKTVIGELLMMLGCAALGATFVGMAFALTRYEKERNDDDA
jgi:cytochrome b subunit of formate dehydrogenase